MKNLELLLILTGPKIASGDGWVYTGLVQGVRRAVKF